MSINNKLKIIQEISTNGGLLSRFFKTKLSKYDFFWNFINRHSRRKYNFLEDEIDEFAYKVTNEVRENGFSVRKLDDFLKQEEITLLVNEVVRKYSVAPRQRGDDWSSKKNYLEYYEGGFFPKELQKLKLDNEFHKFAINETILEIVNNYFNAIGKLCYIELNKCSMNRSDQLIAGSQRVHRDPSFRHCMKVFIYWNDVNENGGPFTYIPKTHFLGKYCHIAPNMKLFGGSYYPKPSLYKQLPQNKLIGSKGTIIFCDTTGLHYGGISFDEPRKMSTFVYYPETDFVKPAIKLQGMDSLINSLSKRQKFCLGL